MSNAPATAPARLVWQRSDGTTMEFPIVAETTRIGRDADLEVFLDEALVSRLHAEIVRTGEEYLVRDLGSTNLTRVNDCVITRCALHHGDELRFARARCVFYQAPATSQPEVAPGDPA
jgi:pSer/pThr/pTyr-binding forkhead associated (FHA) protein